MLCLSGFELYSRWVRLIIRDQVMTLAQSLPETAIIISLFKLVCFLYYNIIPSFYPVMTVTGGTFAWPELM